MLTNKFEIRLSSPIDYPYVAERIELKVTGIYDGKMNDFWIEL